MDASGCQNFEITRLCSAGGLQPYLFQLDADADTAIDDFLGFQQERRKLPERVGYSSAYALGFRRP